MEENKNDVNKEEYQVIQEKIVPKKKNWKRFGKSLLRTALSALVFGIIAGAAIVLSGSFLIKKLGLENNVRQIVGIGDTIPTPKPISSKEPTPTEEAGPTKRPAITSTPVPSQPVDVTSEITPTIKVIIDNQPEGTQGEELIQKDTILDFLNIYSGIAELAGELKRSLVRITAITDGVDWFEEAYETSKNATGLYVGDNGLDMLFLVNLDSIEGATKFEVTFDNGETLPCSIFSYDTNYRLAVLSIRLSSLSTIDPGELPKKAKFSQEAVDVGIPVIILGNPNGHMDAMELGMTTGADQLVQVLDDEVFYFTTGITKYAEGDGFVFNLSGEVIGIVNGTLNKGENGIFTAAMVSGMRSIIEKTLNNIPRVYCGMRLEAVDAVMGGKYNLPEGVYVKEVLPASPAMAAGIKNGDIITMVGIEPVSEVRQFHEEISAAVGQSVRIIVSREIKGERREQTLYMLPETRVH